MTSPAAPRPLRLWPGVVIVALQLSAFFLPGKYSVGSPEMFVAMMGSLLVGTVLLLIWWLFFSRARWSDRLGGLALLVGVHAVTMMLADPSAGVVVMLPGVPGVCAAFVASLFARRRWVTVMAVLVASLGWTLVRTDGVTGSMGAQLAWRWSATAEERFMASNASVVPDQLGPSEPVGEAVWPGFRGVHRDNVVSGITIGTDWSADPPREIWRRSVGPGWGSFTLFGDHLCTQEQREENEAVVCYDAATGEPIWLHAYPARFWEAMGGLGPRATPTYDHGYLFALGATGVLNCLDAATGDAVWTRSIAEDASAPLPNWGFASSPLVVDDLVIVHAPQAADGRGVIAYDVESGEPRWFGQAGGTSYSSPQLATLDGTEQVVMVTSLGAFGLEPASGGLLWKHEWSTGGMGDRVVQPTFLDGGADILIGTSFGMGTRRVHVSRDGSGSWSTSEVWTSRSLKPYYNDLVVHQGTAYGFDGNIFAAIDVATGERAWKGGRYGNGQVLLLADQDLLMVISERGELVLLRASPEGFDELTRMQVLHGKTWNHPIVADGVVYLRNAEEAAAYRLPIGLVGATR